MSTYIKISDLTDSVIGDFDTEVLQSKLELSDDAVEDLAEVKGVRTPDDIKTDPVHYELRRYAIFWVYTEICKDYIGKNNVDIVEQEKYYRKWEIYKSELNELKQSITPIMITGTVGSVRDRAGAMSGTMFRG